MNSRLLLLPLLAAALSTPACQKSEAAESAGSTTEASKPKETVSPKSIPDQPLAAYRLELLDLAFDAVSLLPDEPYLKKRSRAQEAVATACFELDQPQRALRYVEKIDNWRRGAGYADYAVYCIRKGADDVRYYLDMADEISELRGEESPQAWRRDRIRVKIAAAHALLGQAEQAESFEEGIVESEEGKVDLLLSALIEDGEAFDRRMDEIELALPRAGFDLLQHMLGECAELFGRFYDDAPRRARAEERILVAKEVNLPLMVQVGLVMRIAGYAVDHEDPEKASELLARIDELMAQGTPAPEYHIPLVAKLAALRFQAGDEDQARGMADQARALYHEQRDQIVDIFRAEAITPLAEAYHAMGDRMAALAIYGLAVEESLHNPNLRPRAIDLSEICTSLARNDVEPDAKLWAQIREARAGMES